ncbi:helix-turn-helix domain-containing protein [Caproiciproducens galactitolivorans]|uniref:AraC family transcriptional regulator n=1 Tax=Caproiciproducens galactitolivorans TaxID=642589 RepID=A0ABT4BSE5_9FIRM|nr:AraC family transcriptional regulator [Caproiciproducens galactitolivorans]MCY1713827.1 AraC family transcriptional regulator [Caproiciproducens galactitolivorans]
MTQFVGTKLKSDIVIDELMTVHYFEYTSNFYFPGETHDFWEFLYVDKGQVDVTAGENNYVLKKGDIIFHKPFEFHSLSANGIVAPNLIVITFKSNSPAMHFFDNRILRVGDTERSLLGQLIEEAAIVFSSPLDDPDTKMLERSGEGDFAAEQIIRDCLELILINLIRTGGTGEERVSSSIREKAEQDTFARIVAYLNQNIQNKVTLNDVCRDNMCGCSFLQKVFREKTGGGVMEYFGRMKVDFAKQYIREGTKNFTEIANELGYSSIHYFSRHFKKVTGMTPSEYSSSVKLVTDNQKGRLPHFD